jgi:DNA replication and repair protein RecF
LYAPATSVPIVTESSAPARIRRLVLTNFRSYRSAELRARPGPVILVGPNGAGKTNLLEAISWLAPGRGFRRASVEEVARSQGDGSWAISAEVEGALGLATLGTGLPRRAGGEMSRGRQFRVDGESVQSAARFGDHLRTVWLVPAMDNLFAGPASERRRLVDRLVTSIQPAHAGRVAALERSLRSRNRLLQQRAPDPHWLDAIERETAELAVGIAAARLETVQCFAGALEDRSPGSTFPGARIALAGTIENVIAVRPAVDVEDEYRAALRQARGRDAAAGRTLEGPHRTDLIVFHRGKGLRAEATSTGEQKALLVNLVLAQARLVTAVTGLGPVLLLDEVMAHLDAERRAALLDEVLNLRAQVWMSGADNTAFAPLGQRAEVFQITPGRVEQWK